MSFTMDVSKGRPALRVSSTIVLALALSLYRVAGDEEAKDCNNHPGGCRCYYDALADGCPSALPQGGMLALCSCDYRGNDMLRVFTSFYRFFGAASSWEDRLALVSAMVHDEGHGIYSLDAGHKDRLKCSESHAGAWPGTELMLDFNEVGKMANSIFFPQVQQTLMDICAPGRLLMGVQCLHVMLHKGDALAASRYAEAMTSLMDRIDSCIEGNTPWPKLHELHTYLFGWRSAQIPGSEDPRQISQATVRRLSWWPLDLTPKVPGQPGMNLWPCVPMRDWLCFPPGAAYSHESCEYCCDPVHGPKGAPECFDSQFSFERCCQTPGDRGYY
eukprot:TRINITY_DN31108_c0_g1_i1.p1 TRINITY_DN31108_c0_g1~~TRINITY_DN31108_c0_g1_i1.p1  ORF type:complete len:345 (+),score=47.34 TRINITY_DN31108_c0_g1_i1:47-1036(+)